ncbi:MAG: sigma-70 family RNA polymerase sigma factor [Chloroflexi bacterium]|nr:MAG: sigma-70 family RNA polymerase sigma factor [Chloroflexota bacterium]
MLSGFSDLERSHHVADISVSLGSHASIAPVTPEELCALYADRVCRFAAVVAGRDGDPEEIAQEALLKAITKLDRFDPRRGSMEGWLWRIVANTAKDATRKARLRALLTGRLARRDSAVVDLEAVAVERLSAGELLEAIARLSPRDRQLLGLRFVADLDTASVGQIVGLSAESARRAIGRALDRLRVLVSGGLR